MEKYHFMHLVFWKHHVDLLLQTFQALIFIQTKYLLQQTYVYFRVSFLANRAIF